MSFYVLVNAPDGRLIGLAKVQRSFPEITDHLDRQSGEGEGLSDNFRVQSFGCARAEHVGRVVGIRCAMRFSAERVDPAR